MKKKIYQQPQTAVVNVSFEGVLDTYTYVSGYQITSDGGVTNYLGDSDDNNLSGTTNNSGITNSGDGSGSIIITTKKHNLWDVDW